MTAAHPGEEASAELADRLRELAVAAATAREGLRRAEALAAGDDPALPGPRRGPRYPRWDWRRAVRFAVERRMLSRDHLASYLRYARRQAWSPAVEFHGMAFLGRGVELHAQPERGRLELGPWCWIGSRTALRSHEGQLRLGTKVVLGAGNVVNSYLDVEIGADSLVSDAVYVCDFDHRFDRLDTPIRKQGIRTSPVRIGEDVWIGEKVTVLRGADIGTGAVVGSQSLVTGPVPPFSIAVGRPARVLRSRLPRGMLPEEAVELRRRGQPVPGDPLGG